MRQFICRLHVFNIIGEFYLYSYGCGYYSVIRYLNHIAPKSSYLLMGPQNIQLARRGSCDNRAFHFYIRVIKGTRSARALFSNRFVVFLNPHGLHILSKEVAATVLVLALATVGTGQGTGVSTNMPSLCVGRARPAAAIANPQTCPGHVPPLLVCLTRSHSTAKF